MKTIYEDNPCGGVGRMRIDMLLGEDELKDKCRMFARVTLHPGDVLGFHVHNGNGECYYILSGEGVYDDNGVKRTVRAGDVTWTPNLCSVSMSVTTYSSPSSVTSGMLRM